MPKNKHSIRRVVDAAYRTPWAITAEKFDEILALLARRDQGHTPEEILAAFPFDDEDEDDADARGYNVTPGGVAVLSLSGVISQRMNLFSRFSGGTSTEQFSAAVRRALADQSVKALVIDTNSPGGSIGGVEEASLTLFNARGEKPIVAVSNTQMASAAYWIGSAAGEVVASPSSTTGSIGVYMVHSETAKLDEAIGRKRTVISAGRWKTAGNDAEPLTKESRGKLQEFVNSAYDLFAEAVARNRKTSPQAVQSGYGEGDVLFPADAKAAGLVDRIATLDEVIADLESRVAKQTTRAAAPDVPVQPNRQVKRTSIVKGKDMDKRVIAALFAKGLIAEATEEAAVAYFTATSQEQPKDAKAFVTSLFATAAAAPPSETPPAKPAAPVVDAKAIAAQIREELKAEEKRERDLLAQEIAAACELVGLSEEDAKGIVASSKSMTEARAAIKQAMIPQFEPIPRIVPTGSERDKFATGAAAVLDLRCLHAANPAWAPKEEDLPAVARDLRHVRLLDIAEMSLRASGVRTQGLPPIQIARLALNSNNPAILAMAGGGAYYTTGSFSNLTLNSARKVLARAYQEAQVSWRKWARQGAPVVDFKLNSVVKFGEVSDFPEIPEGKDYPTDTGLTDNREYFVATTYGVMVPFTRQMLLNDDLNALSRLPQLLGNGAARTFNKLVYKLITSNPDMADAVALFHASSHGGNLLGTGSTTKAPPSVSTLNDMQTVMRKQTGLNTDTILNTTLRHIIVPAALEGTALELVASQANPASSGNSNVANIWRSTNVVAEAILDATSPVAWYAAADSDDIDTIEVRFLQGEESPVIEQELNFDNDAMKYKCRQTGAAVLVDYRGLVKHTGYSA